SFRTRRQLTEASSEDMESVVVVGFEPEEVVSGAFCQPLPDGKVINLLVKRSSLYQSTLSFRDRSEHRKRCHPAAGPGNVIDSDIWMQTSDLTTPITLPSIHGFENALPSTDYSTWVGSQAA
ncbi:hypothetical protein BG004_005716, partial [Podila humilis]